MRSSFLQLISRSTAESLPSLLSPFNVEFRSKPHNGVLALVPSTLERARSPVKSDYGCQKGGKVLKCFQTSALLATYVLLGALSM